MLHLHPPSDLATGLTDDETDLIAQARSDRRAFAPVYRYCYHGLGAREAAEDATSLVFEKAIAQLATYHQRNTAEQFRSWLFAIAHNVIADHYRAARPAVDQLPSFETIAMVVNLSRPPLDDRGGVNRFPTDLRLPW